MGKREFIAKIGIFLVLMSIPGPLIILLARFFVLVLPKELAFVLAGAIGMVWFACAYLWLRRQLEEMRQP